MLIILNTLRIEFLNIKSIDIFLQINLRIHSGKHEIRSTNLLSLRGYIYIFQIGLLKQIANFWG